MNKQYKPPITGNQIDLLRLKKDSAFIKRTPSEPKSAVLNYILQK